MKRTYISRQEIIAYIRQQSKKYGFFTQYLFKKLRFNLQQRFPSLSSWYASHFPATRLQPKMDAWEYSINFSSELLVAILVIIVAVTNLVIFNPFQQDYTHNDESIAAYVLRHNTGLNNQLATKQNTIRTKVAENGFINQAYADNNSQVLVATDNYEADDSGDVLIDDSGMTRANPDSVQKLVSRQVVIYETKPLDTVYSVAKEYGVSPQTIRETNGLPDNTLKPGWFLVIPPVDGIVVQVNNPNLTLLDVAHAYSADLEKMISYNGLEGPEDMVAVGDYLIVPYGKLPAPKATPAKPTTTKQNKPAIPKAVRIAGNHKFAPGYCTDYVARKVPGIKWGGNANQWIRNSKSFGAVTNMNPVPGAILVTNENSRYGHVAYIEKVAGSKVYISEWNYEGLYKTSNRVIDINDARVKGVIHP